MKIKEILKKKKTYDIYSEVVAHLATPFVILFISIGLTPNMVSMIGILCVFLSGLSFAFNLNILAVLLLYLGLVMDFADGMVARCTNKVSKYQSVYLERIYHEFAYAFVFIGIGYNLHLIGLLLGVICTISILSTSYLFHLKNWILSSFAKQDVREDNFNAVGMNSNISFLFELTAVPTKYIKFILLISVIINILLRIYNIFPVILILYTIYLFLRVPAYFILNYKTLGAFEKCKQ